MYDEKLLKNPKQALKIINQLLELNKELQEDVDKYKYDDLTELELRKDHNTKLKHVFNMLMKYGTEFTYIFIDIDGLHDINRNDDYKTGDAYIRTVVADLKSNFPNYDIYRIGGDEFAVIKTGAASKKLHLTLGKIPNITYGMVSINNNNINEYHSCDAILKATDKIIINKKSKKKRRSSDQKDLTQNETIETALRLLEKDKNLVKKYNDRLKTLMGN